MKPNLIQYWWDQDRIAQRMVGEGDAEVTGVRVARNRRDSESSVSLGGDSISLSLSLDNNCSQSVYCGGAETGGGAGGTGAGRTGAEAAAIQSQESFDEGSVASSMREAVVSVAARAAQAPQAAASPAIPANIAVNNDDNHHHQHQHQSLSAAMEQANSTNSSNSPQRVGGMKRGRAIGAVGHSGGSSSRSLNSASASADANALWATDTEDDQEGPANAHDGGSARKRQRHGPAPPPANASQHQQQQQVIPARSEMVRSEMAAFLKQQRYRSELQQTKTALLHALQMTGGDVTAEPFLHALKRLRGLYKRSGLDCRRQVVSASATAAAAAAAPNDTSASASTPQLEGMWLTLSRPNFHDCLGLNEQREYRYTLGRMSFGMYRPTNLVCSVQGTFNPVHRVDAQDIDEVESVPRSLRRELHEGRALLRTYNIVTAFSIEPASTEFGGNSPNATVSRPIRGIMTTYGYILPDPSTPNRLSVWFTGGTVEVDDEDDADEWKRIFGGDTTGTAAGAAADAGPMAPPRPGPSLSERAKMLAAKLLLGASVPHGMEDDGSMSFQLKRPVGGHGNTYVDTIYLDDTLRIMQGHHGSLYVMARVPGS